MHKIINIILIPNPYPITFILHMNKFMVSVEYQVIVRNKFFFDIIEFMKNGLRPIIINLVSILIDDDEDRPYILTIEPDKTHRERAPNKYFWV